MAFHKLNFHTRMKHQVELHSAASAAGRAPTLLISNVGARPAADALNPQRYVTPLSLELRTRCNQPPKDRKTHDTDVATL